MHRMEDYVIQYLQMKLITHNRLLNIFEKYKSKYVQLVYDHLNRGNFLIFLLDNYFLTLNSAPRIHQTLQLCSKSTSVNCSRMMWLRLPLPLLLLLLWQLLRKWTVFERRPMFPILVLRLMLFIRPTLPYTRLLLRLMLFIHPTLTRHRVINP